MRMKKKSDLQLLV